MNQPLPSTNLANQFAKPNRAADIKLPTAGGKRPKTRRTGGPRPVEPVPDLEPDQTENEAAENADQPLAAEPEPQPAEAAAVATAAPEVETSPAQSVATGKAPQNAPAAGVITEPVTTPRPAPKKATRPAKKSSKADSEPGPLVLWTPKTIRARMQTEKSNSGTVYIVQVLKALEATVDQLPELLAKAEPEVEAVKGKLFEWDAPKQTEQRVQLTIRGMTKHQLQVIDQLVESTGANSRSALVNAALDAFLPQ